MLVVKEILKFIVFVLLQFFVFKGLVLFDSAMVFIYVAFLILLPLNIGKGYLLIIAYVLGCIIDMLYNTGGVHAFACVFVAYFRSIIMVKIVGERDFLTNTTLVPISYLKWNDLAVYSLVMIFIHHGLVLFVEASSFHLFFTLLKKIILSTLLTYFIFISFHYLLKSSK